MTDRCAACGLPFEEGEFHALHPDGSLTHEDSQPSSMRKCREELVRRLVARGDDCLAMLEGLPRCNFNGGTCGRRAWPDLPWAAAVRRLS